MSLPIMSTQILSKDSSVISLFGFLLFKNKIQPFYTVSFLMSFMVVSPFFLITIMCFFFSFIYFNNKYYCNL